MTTKDWFLKDYKKAALSKTRILGPVEKTLIREAVANSGNRDTQFLHPSEISKKNWCPKASWYVIKEGKRPDESVNLKRLNIFAEGHNIHGKWQKWMADSGLLEGQWYCPECSASWYDHLPNRSCPFCEKGPVSYNEVPISNEEYHVLGHADGILVDSDGKAVVEIKSVGLGSVRFEAPDLFVKYSKGQQSIDGLWRDIKSPFASHLKQINLYMFFLGIDQGVVLYEFKATQEVKEFSLKFQPYIIEGILRGCKAVKLALDTDTTPMRPNWATDPEVDGCKGCPYKTQCWSSLNEDHPGEGNTGMDEEVPVQVRLPEASSGEGAAAPRVVRRPA